MVPVGFSPEPLLAARGRRLLLFRHQSTANPGANGPAPGHRLLRNPPIRSRLSRLHLTPHDRTQDPQKPPQPNWFAFSGALLRGHAVNAADPAYGARLAVDRYGADLGLDLQQQTTLNRLQIPLETEPGATIPFWFSEEAFAGPMYAAARVTGRPHASPTGNPARHEPARRGIPRNKEHTP